MNESLLPPPPNPTRDTDPEWTSFARYLASNRIIPVEDAAFEAYQHAAQGRFLCAAHVNHCLTLEGAGAAYGGYGGEGETPVDILGELDDFADPSGGDFQVTRSAIDRLFGQHGIRFDSATRLYKGINSADIYRYLELNRVNEGESITFFGYVSTSICRENAERFAKARTLLIFSGVDGIAALVPPNASVKNAPTGDVPEQEVLLGRGYKFRVNRVCTEASTADAGSLRVLYLEADGRAAI